MIRLERVFLSLALIASLVGCDRAPDWVPMKPDPRYCEATTDCKDAKYPVCDVPARECVEQLGIDGGADLGDMGMLDVAMPDLMPECATSATCPADRPLCDVSSGTCRACVSGAADDASCAARDPAAPYCGSSGSCVECLQSMQCAATEPVCSSSGACGACSSAADDAVCLARDAAKGHCEFTAGPNLGRCVACASSSQCAAATPVCELVATDTTRNTCRACRAHSECGAGLLCDLGDVAGSATVGQCVSPVVVDRNAAAGCKTSGTEAKPWCQIAQALAGEAVPAAGPLFVLVRGAGVSYDNFTIDKDTINKKVVLVGESGGAAPIILKGGEIGVSLNFSAAATASLVLEGLQVGAPSGATRLSGAAISCVGTNATVSLRVRNCTVAGVLGGPGLSSTSCALTIEQATIINNEGGGLTASGGALVVERSTFSSNAGGGLTANTTDYRIVNNLIVKNGATGVIFDGSTPKPESLFWFNTITKNGQADVEGGVNCGSLSGANTRSVANSVVSNNTSASGTQFNGKCAFASVVAGAGETSIAAGLNKTDPPFVDGSTTATDPAVLRAAFSIAATDTTVCVDQLDAAAGFPAVDLFGTARPQGSKFDIGMNEVVK